MLLEVRHVTQYQYAVPVRESVMEVWMQPQRSARQRLVSFDLDLDPAAQVFSYADSFGNAVYHFDVPQPHDRLTITARAAVETQAAAPLPGQLDLGEWDRLRSEFLRGEKEVGENNLGHLMALSGVKEYPLRVKCATLGWQALLKALDRLKA